jgi:hypothetical protein
LGIIVELMMVSLIDARVDTATAAWIASEVLAGS